MRTVPTTTATHPNPPGPAGEDWGAEYDRMQTPHDHELVAPFCLPEYHPVTPDGEPYQVGLCERTFVCCVGCGGWVGGVACADGHIWAQCLLPEPPE